MTARSGDPGAGRAQLGPVPEPLQLCPLDEAMRIIIGTLYGVLGNEVW